MVNPAADCGSPAEWASRKQAFEFKGKVADYPRLVEIVRTDLADVPEDAWPIDWQNAPVEADLTFGWADETSNRPLMTGRLSAKLAVLCQRCLEPFVLPVAADIDMLLQADSDSNARDSDQEVWEIVGDKVCIKHIVEELLVMAMPLSAKHESIDLCGALVTEAQDEASAARPFANLRAQLDSTN